MALGKLGDQSGFPVEFEGMLKLRAILFVGLTAALALAAGFQGDLFGRSHGPRGKLMTARPTLVWEVWSTQPGEIVGGRAKVGNRQVPARYDSQERKIIVELGDSLDSGEHRVTVWARLRDGQSISKSWNLSVSPDALTRLPRPSNSQQRALEAVNRFRSKMGLEPAQMDDSLNAASLYHSKYLAETNTTGHFEAPGKPGFVATEPGDRHMAFGWVGNSWEAVAFGSTDEEEAVHNLIDAPYHRIPFIQPGELSFGSGYSNLRLTTAFSMSSKTATVVYPYERQSDAPTQWSFRERPDPLRIHPGAKRPVGYPVMLVYFSDHTETLDVRSATLRDAQGSIVPCYLSTPDNDDELKNAVVLIPKSPLQPEAQYSARVEAEVVGGPSILKSWTFRTVRSPPRSSNTK
jgi:hypothetical protein